jgi:2-(1,2-epoxy-1,2-dihydrophenyl)acetyl-CoA isomerase
VTGTTGHDPGGGDVRQTAAMTSQPSPHAPVLLEVVDGVATITLNRPEAMNGLDVATKELLRDTVHQVAEDPAVRCVVLTGSGRAFCVGQDLKEHLAGLKGDSSVPLSATVEEHYNPIALALATRPKPVIAAVNGVAAGAGVSLALAADFRVLVDTAGFNTSFAGVALSCDTGSSWSLPRLVGRAKAIELLYFPRTVDAAEALELGLANRVVPAEELAEAVGELASRLASGPTVAFGSIRRAVAHAAAHPIEEALRFEAEMMALTGGTEDHLAAVDAFVAKEKPVFRGR